MADTITLTCKQCGEEFEKTKKEYKRQIREGRTEDSFLCSLSCSGSWGNSHREISGNPEAFQEYNDNRLDEYSPFRYHVNKARNRSKQRGYQFDLDNKYLKEVWERQNGVCPLTGWKLNNPESTTACEEDEITPDRASLDRIDSNEGYVKGNVRFIAYIANMAKNRFSDKEVVKFCKAVATNPTDLGV